MPALFELVVMDEFGIRALCPAPRGWIEFVRKDAHGNRDGGTDALDTEERRPLVLPIETGTRKRCVRQPGDRDVVEDVVAREALRLSVKDARDELIAALVVVKEISRQADGGIRNSVQLLRSQPHLEPVPNPLGMAEPTPLVTNL